MFSRVVAFAVSAVLVLAVPATALAVPSASGTITADKHKTSDAALEKTLALIRG